MSSGRELGLDSPGDRGNQERPAGDTSEYIRALTRPDPWNMDQEIFSTVLRQWTRVEELEALGVAPERIESAKFQLGKAVVEEILNQTVQPQAVDNLLQLVDFQRASVHDNHVLGFWEAMANYAKGDPSYAADVLLAMDDLGRAAYSNEIIGLLKEAGRNEEAHQQLMRLKNRND